MMMWGITILFAVLSIVLLSGRGSFLIAGYNTASKERKSRCDEKKLCRVVGGGLGIIAILLGVLAAYGENQPGWLIKITGIINLCTIIGTLVLANTICKVKDGADEEGKNEKTAEKSKRDAKLLKGSGIFTIVVFVFVGIMLTTGNVKVIVDENALNIKASYWTDDRVKLGDIKSVTYRDDFNVGGRASGVGSFRLQEGNFKNSEFGNYTLYAYTRCDEYVVLETQGRMVVLNGKTPEETKKLYEMIQKAIDET